MVVCLLLLLLPLPLLLLLLLLLQERSLRCRLPPTTPSRVASQHQVKPQTSRHWWMQQQAASCTHLDRQPAQPYRQVSASLLLMLLLTSPSKQLAAALMSQRMSHPVRV
jgi:hypothetical protein